MKTAVTTTTYQCDVCGYKDVDEDNFFSGDKSFLSLRCHEGDGRDVGPSHINFKYAGCNIPYSPTTPKDVCIGCVIKSMKKWIEENE